MYFDYTCTSYSERGNKKRARNHLRAGPVSKTHFSTFHSGLWLGLAFPAIAGGCYLCRNIQDYSMVSFWTPFVAFQQQTRGSLPSWNILLFIYSILLVPVLLALLIGVNVFVWAHSRINYVFILSALLSPCSICSLTICTELNPRSKVDYREYFEVCVVWQSHATQFWPGPKASFFSLVYPCLRVLVLLGSNWSPNAVALGLARSHPRSYVKSNPRKSFSCLLILLVQLWRQVCLDVQSFMWGQARWWTIKKIAKLGASGMWTAEVCHRILTSQGTSKIWLYPSSRISGSGMISSVCFTQTISPCYYQWSVLQSCVFACQPLLRGLLLHPLLRGLPQSYRAIVCWFKVLAIRFISRQRHNSVSSRIICPQ